LVKHTQLTTSKDMSMFVRPHPLLHVRLRSRLSADMRKACSRCVYTSLVNH